MQKLERAPRERHGVQRVEEERETRVGGDGIPAAAHLCGEMVLLQRVGARARGRLGPKRANDQLMLERLLQKHAHGAFLFLHGLVQRLQPSAQRARQHEREQHGGSEQGHHRRADQREHRDSEHELHEHGHEARDDGRHAVRHDLHVGEHAVGKLAGMEAQNVAEARGEDAIEHRFPQLKGETGPNALLGAVDSQAKHQLRDDNASKYRRACLQAVDVSRDRLVYNGAARQREAHEHRRLHRAQHRQRNDAAVLRLRLRKQPRVGDLVLFAHLCPAHQFRPASLAASRLRRPHATRTRLPARLTAAFAPLHTLRAGNSATHSFEYAWYPREVLQSMWRPSR